MAKFCGECGAKVENSFNACPECGHKLDKSNTKVNNTTNNKQPLPTWVIVLLSIAGFFILIGLFGSSDETENKDNSLEENKSVEELLKDEIRGHLYVSDTFSSIDLDNESNKYIVNVEEKTSALSYLNCAKNTQSFAKNISGNEKISKVVFKCVKSSDVIGYVEVTNILEVTEENIDSNTKFYDADNQEISTSIEQLEKEDEAAKKAAEEEERKQKEKEEKEYKNACKKLKYKDVLRNPSDYDGVQAYWFGKVYQKVSSTQYRVGVNCEKNRFATGGYICDDYIYVLYYGDTVLIEDDIVKIYGEMDRTKTYETVLGASVTVPQVSAEYIDIVG